MASDFIYVQDGSRTDFSRWLRVVPAGDFSIFELTDLCMPGRVSTLSQVRLPRQEVEGALESGSIQITNALGYLYLQRLGNDILVEFRGTGDASPCRACVPAAELTSRLRGEAVNTSGPFLG